MATTLSVGKHIRADMVRRVDVAPRLVDPMGIPRPVRTSTTTNDTGDTVLPSPGLRRRRLASTAERPPVTPTAPCEVGFGGFPSPREVLGRTSQRYLPQLHRQLQKTLTIPRTATLIPENTATTESRQTAVPTRPVPYLSFAADVGKNSRFKGLSEEQLLELGGVEYSALNALMWLVPLVSSLHTMMPSILRVSGSITSDCWPSPS